MFLNRFFARVSLILLFSLGACVNASSIADEPLRSGHQSTFTAPYEKVTDAAIASLHKLDVSITQVTKRDDGTVILLSKHPGAFSWGEVGRVFVEKPNGPDTTVYAIMELRSTSTNARGFSGHLFTHMKDALEK